MPASFVMTTISKMEYYFFNIAWIFYHVFSTLLLIANMEQSTKMGDTGKIIVHVFQLVKLHIKAHNF